VPTLGGIYSKKIDCIPQYFGNNVNEKIDLKIGHFDPISGQKKGVLKNIFTLNPNFLHSPKV